MVRQPRSSGRTALLRDRALRSLKNIAARTLPRRNPRLPSDRLSPFSRRRLRRSKSDPQSQANEAITTPTVARRIPLAAKLAYTAFMAVLVPSYTYFYGPTNFLYFCDVALLVTLVAMWAESPLLASMPAVGILLPQALWVVDFLGGCVGHHVTGMSAYMFHGDRTFLSLFKRGLSFFHFWLPFLVLWNVWRLGYDRRALAAWSVLAWGLLLLCYFAMPAPPTPASNPDLPVNINYVYGPSDDRAQTWMPPLAWLALLMVGMPAVIYVPTHLVLTRVIAPAPSPRPPVST
jgi:hypothetical protein